MELLFQMTFVSWICVPEILMLLYQLLKRLLVMLKLEIGLQPLLMEKLLLLMLKVILLIASQLLLDQMEIDLCHGYNNTYLLQKVLQKLLLIMHYMLVKSPKILLLANLTGLLETLPMLVKMLQILLINFLVQSQRV